MPPGDDNVIKYNIQVDTTQVQGAIDQMQRAAEAAASGVGGVSSNTLGAIGNVYAQGMGGYNPGMGVSPGLMAGAMAPQLAAMYSANPMSAAGQMAYSALQMQYQAMGPYTSGITGAYGSPNFSLMGQPASPFQLPINNMLSYAPPSFGSVPMSRRMFGAGPGTALDMGMMAFTSTAFGRIGNDNLEDRMYRMIERRSEGFAENLARFGRFTTMDLGLGGAGAALGALAGGPIGGFLGGIVGTGLGGLTNRTIDRLAAPIVAGAQDFRNYTAPFVRGDRLGGGMGFQEMVDLQKEMAVRMTSDKWFTSKEYGELIKVAGETGVFQFTNNKQQALDAIDKLGESVKTLYSLGVKSREMLSTLSTAMSQYGIDTTNSQQMTNFFTGMSVSARAAGISTGEMIQAAAPAAQMGMAQGLGPAYGAGVYASARGQAMGMMNTGRFGAFENALYGGAEGMANTMTQTHMQLLRSPIGETSLMSIMQNPQLLRKAMEGQGLSVDEILGGASSLAGLSPMKYMGLKARLPYITQQLPPEVMMNLQGATYLEQFKNIKGPGKINQEEFIAFLQAMGVDPRGAMLMTDMLAGGGDTARRNLLKGRDTAQEQMIEGMRGPDIGRLIDRGVDKLRVMPANLLADLNARAYHVVEGLEEQITGVRGYKLGGLRSEMSKPFGLQESFVKGRQRSRELGIGGTRDYLDADHLLQQDNVTQKIASDLARGDANTMDQFRKRAKAMNFSDEAIDNYVKLGAGETISLKLESDAKGQISQMLRDVTGKGDDKEALRELQRDQSKYRAEFNRRLTQAGMSEAYGDAFLNNADLVVVNKDTAGEAAMGRVRSVMNSMTGITPGGLDRVGIAKQAGRIGDYDSAGVTKMVQSRKSQLIAKGASESAAEEQAKREVDTYLQRSKQDSDGTFGTLPGIGINERDFGNLPRSDKIALSSETRAEIDKIAGEMISKHNEFQAANIDFVQGLSDTDQSKAKSFIERYRSDSGGNFRTKINEAISGSRENRANAVAQVLYGRDASYLSADQKRVAGQFVAGLGEEDIQANGASRDGIIQNLKELKNSNINSGNAFSMTIEESQKKKGELIDRLAGRSSVYRGISKDNLEDAIVATNVALDANVARILQGSSSIDEAMKELSADGSAPNISREAVEDIARQYGIDPNSSGDEFKDRVAAMQSEVINKAEQSGSKAAVDIAKGVAGRPWVENKYGQAAMGALADGLVVGGTAFALSGFNPLVGAAGFTAGAVYGAQDWYKNGTTRQEALGMTSKTDKKYAAGSVEDLLNLRGNLENQANTYQFMSEQDVNMMLALQGLDPSKKEDEAKVKAVRDSIKQIGDAGSDLTKLQQGFNALITADAQTGNRRFKDERQVNAINQAVDLAKGKKSEEISIDDYQRLLVAAGYDPKSKAVEEFTKGFVNSSDRASLFANQAREAMAQASGSRFGPDAVMADRVGSGNGVLDEKTMGEFARTIRQLEASALASQKIADNFEKSDFPKMLQDFTTAVKGVTDPMANFADETDKKALRVVIARNDAGGGASPATPTKGATNQAASPDPVPKVGGN